MDIKKFQEERGIGNAEAIEAIRTVFPKYSKAVHSMVGNAPMYGVALAPKAVKVLKAAYPTEQEQRVIAALHRMEPMPIDMSAGSPHCPVCGVGVVPGHKFCPECGQRIGGENV